MGYLPADADFREIGDIKYRLTPCVENEYIRGMVFQYAERYPTKKIELND